MVRPSLPSASRPPTSGFDQKRKASARDHSDKQDIDVPARSDLNGTAVGPGFAAGQFADRCDEPVQQCLFVTLNLHHIRCSANLAQIADIRGNVHIR